MADAVRFSGQMLGIIPGARRIMLLSVQTERIVRHVLFLREMMAAFRRIRRGARFHQRDGFPEQRRAAAGARHLDGVDLISQGCHPRFRVHV